MKFTKTHEWIATETSPCCVGITEHAQALLGDLVYIELPTEGDQVKAGDELGVVESVKAASDFYAPIDGTIVAVNHRVKEDPTLVNRDAEGDGWLVKMAPDNINALEELLDEAQYLAIIHEDQ